MMWAAVLGSAWFCVPSLWLDLALIAIACGVTIYLLRLPTCDSAKNDDARSRDP